MSKDGCYCALATMLLNGINIATRREIKAHRLETMKLFRIRSGPLIVY